MSRQDANALFARTSFLYGGNAAYIEDLYAKFENDPASVDAAWREFFTGLKDSPADVAKSARGASWQKPNWPLRPNGDLVAAHTHLLGSRTNPGAGGLRQVHLFRFRGDTIVEYWDITQMVGPDQPNAAGAF